MASFFFADLVGVDSPDVNGVGGFPEPSSLSSPSPPSLVLTGLETGHLGFSLPPWSELAISRAEGGQMTRARHWRSPTFHRFGILRISIVVSSSPIALLIAVAVLTDIKLAGISYSRATA